MQEENDVWLWDFLLGCGAVMILFCLMSVLGVGSIGALKTAVAATGIGTMACNGRGAIRKAAEYTGRQRQYDGSGSSLDAGGVVRKRNDGCDWRNPDAGGAGGSRERRFKALLVVFMIVMVLIQVGRMGISLDFDSLWYGVRSEYILDNGHGIYENLGSVGLVYTYPKGLEILLLPLADLASHSYLIFFNVWLAVASLVVVYRISRFYMNTTGAMLAAACVSSLPAVMNMSITAKTDTATLLVQLAMVLFILHYLKERQVWYLIAGLGAFLLSWTLKPTAVVFSTAVFGMSVLYLIGTKKLAFRAPWREWVSLLIPGGALAAVWARTLMIVGIPVTSVFSSIFLKLGFQLNYPFSVLPLNGSSVEEGSRWQYLADTLYRMLLNPTGDEMSHVVIAWGTSLPLFFGVMILLAVFAGKRRGAQDSDQNLVHYAHTVMIPFVVVCLVSLMMLGQIDGNYFMLLDVFLVLYGCVAVSRAGGEAFRKGLLVLMFPLLLFHVPVTMVSNWAWSLGYTPVDVWNKGRINHRELQHREMAELGNSGIWEILAADPQTRVIAAGEHPLVFSFPCNVQSYDDITSSWGNVRLVKTMDAFIEYLSYAQTDYIYMQAGAVEEGSRCHELMGYLIEAGILTDVIYENGNLLAKVDLQGNYGPEATSAYETYVKTYPVRPRQ